ncbi:MULTISPECIES: hypothetical protein [Agrobacterium]|uniref:Uncharacterized protein n=1 Tax=Agrobacterium tumefaciens TaxID=358 RepID=A0AAE6BBM4_AGRTU|nr:MULTISPECIES: hypothetical protein [Agrobacterium]QCL73416.1 hypothetical protein CFBP5499_08300 [Agrobacterium tumefaciens]QCL78988.1 hypothetical protein CFBP5877_07830 [Agrobacterium tumefaciens]CUX42247.1 conserved hypothetical protein [Agrobacterium sp. NCPPB 925]
MFKSVSESAAAADGGSLALFVERMDGQTEVFVIHRSLASRGTPDYNKITSSLRPLSAEDCRVIAAELEPLLVTTDSIHPLADFINTFKRQSSSFES